MVELRDRRVIIGVGALAAVAVGGAIAFGVGRGADPVAPPPAAEGGLQIDVGEGDRAALDPTKPLRCFVDGQFVGIETLTACAQKNGVAAQALDVGLDDTGALAAATEGVNLAPVPPPVDIAADLPAPRVDSNLPPLPDLGPLGPTQASRPNAAFGSCMQHTPNGWITVSEAAPLSVCVTLLFDGRCEQPGNARYGRWGEQTVRLVPGKIEIATDGQTFTTLAEQGLNCTIPRI